MKTFYPKMNVFRKLIYLIYNTGVIKNYGWALQRAKNKLDKVKTVEDDALPLFLAFDYISNKYSMDVENDYNMYKIFTYDEISKYQRYSHRIYYDIDCRNDILQFPAFQIFYLSIASVAIIIVCLISMVIFTWNYVRKKPD